MPEPDVQSCVTLLIGAGLGWLVSWLRGRMKK